MNYFFSTSLAILLHALPDLSRKIQTTVAVNERRVIAGEFANHAAAEQTDSAADDDGCPGSAHKATLFSAAEPGVAGSAG